MQGIHADDPALLLGRANALIELGRAAEAQPLVDKLLDEQATRSPATALAQARVLEALGSLRRGGYRLPVGRRDACPGPGGAGPLRRLPGPRRPQGRSRRQPRRDRSPHRQGQPPVPPRRPRLARSGGAGAGPGLTRTS
ncbi:MAG: hypothetical protein WDM85_14285 [Caulobacteraceae bacterium]